MATKYYAVKNGKTPGVYETWDECKANVLQYPGAEYKSFSTKEEAYAYLGKLKNNDSDLKQPEEEKSNEPDHAYAYIDGSYNPITCVYGYGGFLVYPEFRGVRVKQILQNWGDDPEMKSMRNVAGEISGSLAAIENVYQHGYREITIYYDYEGICAWAEGVWMANKPGTMAYQEAIRQYRMKKGMIIHFVHVKGHSGIAGNEEADRLAKDAVGVK